MSEILGRTWAFLTSSGSGPKWSVPSNQSTPTAHLPHGLAQFIKAVMGAPTAHDEAELVQSHLHAVKAKLKEPGLKTSVLADCIVRSMLCSLLGHPVEFAHIHALQLAQKGTVTEKKIGYMGCVLFLQEHDDLILLLINTIVKDLQSSNVAETNMALVAAAYLVPNEMAPMIVPILKERTTHSKDFVRKKALICLEQVALKNADTAQQAFESAIQCLSDKDPGVVSTSIQVISTLLHSYPLIEADVTDGVCAVQRQILDGKLPQEFFFHGTPAPWTQMNILKLLAQVGNQPPHQNRDTIIELVVNTIEQPFSNDESVGQAVIYECIMTLAVLLPKELQEGSRVVKRIMRYLAMMINSEHSNNKYVGLSALQLLLANREQSILAHLSPKERSVVFQSLDDPDESIQRKSFALLNSLATGDNVGDICEKLISRVKSIDDEFSRTDLINRTIQLVQRFSDTKFEWRTFVLLRLLQSSSNSGQKEALLAAIQMDFGNKPFSPQVNNVGSKLKELLAKPARELNAPWSLRKLYLWTIANFVENELESCQNIIETAMKSQLEENVVSYTLQLLFEKLYPKAFKKDNSFTKILREFVEQCKKLPSISVQDSAHELAILIDIIDQVGDIWTVEELPNSNDFTLSYLDHVVVQALQYGSPVYAYSKKQLPTACPAAASPSLRFTPYNILEESYQVSEGKSSGSAKGSAVPEVWTLQGRKDKKVDVENANSTSNDETFDESEIQDVTQWR